MAAEKYDDVLLPFLSLMRKELHANAGKGDRPGWLAMRCDEALLEVYYHLAKLQKAVKHNDGPAIMEYSADVANMAMMVLDICGGLVWVEANVGVSAAVGPDLSGKAAVERLCGPRRATLPTRRAASCFSSCANANQQPCTTECAARGVMASDGSKP